MERRHITAEVKLVHPIEATEWLQKYPYDKQRGLRAYHAQFIGHLMRHKRFREGSCVDFAVFPTGEHCLVNGQHTLSGLVREDVPYVLMICRHPVATSADVATLYSTFDRQLTRSPSDMVRAYGFQEVYGLNWAQTNGLYAAVKLVLSGFCWGQAGASQARAYLRDEVLLYAAMCEWATEAKRLWDDLAGIAPDLSVKLERQAVYAVALVLYRYHPEKAHAFLQEVGRDTGKEFSPAKKLVHFLLETPMRHVDGGATRYARYIATAWNAFYRGRTVKKIVPQDMGNPMQLDGTPHARDSVMRYVSPAWEVLHDPVPYAEPMYSHAGGRYAVQGGV